MTPSPARYPERVSERVGETGFAGFGDHALDFYLGIEADNSKAYWSAHRHVYDRDVREPMEALLAELTAEFGDFGAPKVFRPYRDVRFARDKTPYKTHCGAVFERGRGGGAFYVAVSADGLRVGGGSFHLAPDQLRRYRVAVADERRGTDLERLLADLTRCDWDIHGELLKTAPRGFGADHPRLALLRRRALYVSRADPPDDLVFQPGAVEWVRSAWRRIRALNEWMADHVGVPAESQPSGRY